MGWDFISVQFNMCTDEGRPVLGLMQGIANVQLLLISYPRRLQLREHQECQSNLDSASNGT